MLSIRERSDWTGYEAVSIAYEAASIIDVAALQAGQFIEVPVSPFHKDYDELERPSELAKAFDTAAWQAFAAYDSELLIGGSIVAWNCPAFEMLENRVDLAVIVDLRVANDWRGRGVGRSLFLACVAWAKGRGCRELNVETQDRNPAACRFYAAMGCRLKSIEMNAYADLDEAKIVWQIDLTHPE